MCACLVESPLLSKKWYEIINHHHFVSSSTSTILEEALSFRCPVRREMAGAGEGIKILAAAGMLCVT